MFTQMILEALILTLWNMHDGNCNSCDNVADKKFRTIGPHPAEYGQMN